jgi:hypothetical protein
MAAARALAAVTVHGGRIGPARAAFFGFKAQKGVEY